MSSPINLFLFRIYFVKLIWVQIILGHKKFGFKNNLGRNLGGGFQHNLVKPTSTWLWLSWVLTIVIINHFSLHLLINFGFQIICYWYEGQKESDN